MKRALILLCPLALLVVTTGCDEMLLEGLPPNVQALVSGVDGVKIDLVSQDGGFGAGSGDQVRQRLMDGSCEGDGNQYQYQYAGSNGAGGNGSGGAGGSGNGDQLRLRDGSCGACD
ncbi:MAG: hypothetical protein KKB50_10165 [Planctomycetes bacterium]|nr:hypothetical protein [Planctomycetota bacterium]